MWTFIGIVVLIVIIKFVYDSSQQKEAVQKQGGMTNKYATLIAHIMAGDPRTKITRITSDSVDIVLSNVGGATAFFLTQTFGKLTVQWKVQSPIYGNHKLEWDFPEFLDQDKMIERITNDVGQYQMNVFTARNF
jgi:hypothetical protein